MCRKDTFYNPLLIIYTPLKRSMAPPSIFYFYSAPFFHRRLPPIRRTISIIIRIGTTIGARREKIPPITATTSMTIPSTPKITSSFFHHESTPITRTLEFCFCCPFP